MNEHPFHSFIELIDFDREVYSIQDNITQCEQEIAQLTLRKKEQADFVDRIKNKVDELQKKVDETELEMKSLDQQEKSKKAALEGISNYKEYQSLQSEIDHLKKEQHQYESVLLEAWNNLETAQRELEHTRSSIDSVTADLDKAISEKEQEIIQLREQLDDHMAQRSQKEQGIPDEWLEKYSTMRVSIPDPVVTIQDDSCSACFHSIPRQEMIRFKRGALLQCKGCFRFLYLEQAIAKSNEQGSDH
jgi:predicted  nucleic acid-binding Zn-ribbon protein